MIYKLIWSLKRSTKLGLIMKSASGGNKTHHFFQEKLNVGNVRNGRYKQYSSMFSATFGVQSRALALIQVMKLTKKRSSFSLNLHFGSSLAKVCRLTEMLEMSFMLEYSIDK